MSDWHLLIGMPQCLDSLDLLAMVPDGVVNAVITDPPYGTGTTEWDKEPDPQVWPELRRVCPHGPIAVMGYAKQLMRWAQYFDGLNLIGYIVWFKYNEPVVSPGLTRIHQDVAIFGTSLRQVRAGEVREPYSRLSHLAEWYMGHHGQYKGKPSDLSTRVMQSKSGKNYSEDNFYRHPDGRRCTDLWRIPAIGAGFNSHLRKHKNQKPDELLDRLIRLLTSERDLVLDCYAGSFSLAFAAQRLGRRWICGDNCAKYVEQARAALAQPQQLALEVSA